MKYLVPLLILLVIIIRPESLHGQNDSVPYQINPVRLNGQYVKSYFTESWDIIKSPVYWNGKQWLTAGLLTGSCVLVGFFDEGILQFFQDVRSPFTDNLSKYFLDPYGKGLIILPLLGGTYIYGLARKNRKAEAIALNGVKTFIISGLFSQVIKHITHRHRPYQDIPPDPHAWGGPITDIKYTAFPSGHTMTAFAMAAFFSSTFREKIWVGITAYSLAALTGLARINDNKHWATDVLVGAILGHFIGRLVWKNSVTPSGLDIQPVYSSQFKGLQLVWSIGE